MGWLRGTWDIPPATCVQHIEMLSSPSLGSTMGNAFGMSRASFSVAGVVLPSVGTPVQPWPSGKPMQPRRLRRMAFRIPALQLLLTPYELPVGPVGLSESYFGDCNVERKICTRFPRGAGGVDTYQECFGPEAFQLAQCSDQSTPLVLHLRDLTPYCITCELLVVALSLQCFPFVSPSGL